ncbi:MAG: MBL fold metallo-hydrolase [Anaerolineae bacterium]|nr:MBL fold metallo-hydrolase [Anaerolineae bacterium]
MHPTSKHFDLEPLTDGVYAVIAKEGGVAGSNAGIVDLGDRVLVFDLGMAPQGARDLISAAQCVTGRPVTLAINSHWHPDHVLGNQALPPATALISTARTRTLIAERIPAIIAQRRKETSEKLGELHLQLQNVDDPEKTNRLGREVDFYRMVMEDMPGLAVRVPEVTFQGKVTFHGPARRVELVTFGGGHTASDALLLLPDDQILFAGDLLFHECHPWLGDGDPDEWLRIYNAIEALDPPVQVIVPGHGAVATPEALAALRRYLPVLQRLVDDLHKNHGTVDDAAAVPVPAAFSDWQEASTFARNMRFLFERTGANHD